MRTKRSATAVLIGLTLALGVPGAALAETDVVLYNESEGTDVKTGESSFNNSTANESQSATFDPPSSAAGSPVTTTTSSAPVLAPSAPAAPRVSVPSTAAKPAAPAAVTSASRQIETLFVGLALDGSVGP